MKEGECLKYNKEKLFNSEYLKQYDSEGQRYFLAYLLKENYNLKIRSNEIIFTDILSEDMVSRIAKKYDNDARKQVLRAKIEATREIERMGIIDYTISLKKQMKELDNIKRGRDR